MNQLVVTVVISLITALIGAGGGGFIVAWRKDARQAPLDTEAARKAKIEVTSLIEDLATQAVAKAKQQLADQEQEATRKLHEQAREAERRLATYQKEAKELLAAQENRHHSELNRLSARIEVLEDTVRDAGMTVPPWSSNG